VSVRRVRVTLYAAVGLVLALAAAAWLVGTPPGGAATTEGASASAGLSQGPVPTDALEHAATDNLLPAGDDSVDAPVELAAPVDEGPGHLVELRFPDGTSTPVRLRRADVEPPPIDFSRAPLEQLDVLRELAAGGHGAAARMLHSALRTCSLRRSTGLTLEESLQRVRDRPLPTGMPLEQATRLEEGYRACFALSAEQLDEAPRWAEQAARAGDVLGTRDWAIELGETAAALAAWESMWERGMATALQGLVRLYDRPIPGRDADTPDPVRAHAFALIDFALREARVGTPANAFERRMLLMYGEALQNRAWALNPQQHREAVTLARELVRQNAACCVVLP
jgi:hypothetical protein